MSDVRDTMHSAQAETGWTPDTEREVLLSWLDNHAPKFAREEAARYVEQSAAGNDDKFHPRSEMLRREVVSRLTRLHPIIAARGIRLDGVGPKELRDINLVLKGIEDHIANLNRKVRQPWRNF